MKPYMTLAFGIVVLLLATLLAPTFNHTEAKGRYQVGLADELLRDFSAEIETFYVNEGRLPDARELRSYPRSNEVVQEVTGNNPYFAMLKRKGVHPELRGRSLSWYFDVVSAKWDTCAGNTVPFKFIPQRCRGAEVEFGVSNN